MKRFIKALSVLCLTVCMLFSSLVPVQAAVDSSELIEMFNVYILNTGDGELEIDAYISTVPTCDELKIIYVELYEQDEDGDWIYLDSWSTSIENDSLLALREYYNGTIGKTYRAEAGFRAIDGDIEETRTLTSSKVVCRR